MIRTQVKVSTDSAMSDRETLENVRENGHTLPMKDVDEEEKEDEEEEEEGQGIGCGLGEWRPLALSACATIPVFTGFYSIISVVTSTLNSYVNSQVTTLERHFGFSSGQTGVIMAANDVGFLSVILIFSYVASSVHIPRTLGAVCVLFGVSGIVCALPFFIYGAPSPPVADLTQPKANGSSGFTGQICDGFNGTGTSFGCSDTNEQDQAKEDHVHTAQYQSSVSLAVIVLGMGLQGLAKAPRWSFATAFIDNNLKHRHNTGFYMGIITASGILGPAVAFVVGGLFARIYVTLEDTNLYYRHPRWIGAWWLGYITFGVAAILVAVPMFCFPASLRGRRSDKTKDKTKPDRSNKVALFTLVKGFAPALCRLATNPVYVLVSLAHSLLLFSVAGGNAFTPKYIENQFSMPAWKTNLSLAAVTLCSAVVGTFAGGVLTRRFKMSPMTSIKFVTTMQGCSWFFMTLILAFKCPQPFLYNSPGPRASEETSLPDCYDNCACDDTNYFPVCGDDGKSFFSPCHAGCQQSVGATGYSNCTCISGGLATAGLCDYSCPMFYPFIICKAFMALTGTLAIIPKLMILVRGVEERDKALAVGAYSFMTSSTAWMLGPIVFGILIDNICIQWEGSGCSGRGSCSLYDNDNFRWKLIGYQSLFRGLGFVIMVLALLCARKSPRFKEDPPVADQLQPALGSAPAGPQDEDAQSPDEKGPLTSDKL